MNGGELKRQAETVQESASRRKIHNEADSRYLLSYFLVGKGHLKTYWLLGHDSTSDRRRSAQKGIVLPPPLFNVRESENWRRSPKTEFPRRKIAECSLHKPASESDSPLVNGLVGGKGKHLTPPRPQTRDVSQSDPWDGNELGWNAAFDGSNPDSLEYQDEGFDGRYQSSSRKSSNNSKTTGRESETASLTAVDEITKPLLCTEHRRIENIRRFRHKQPDSWKRSLSADAIDLPKVLIKDWLANVFSNNTNEKMSSIIPGTTLHTVKENDKEESVV